jgi:purine-binding chemotaxis protein CheW
VSDVHLRLRIGAETYSIPVENVREVTEFGDVAPVPGCGPAVLGVRNLRGRVLPVFDLARVFGIASSGSPPRLVVAEAGGRLAGLAVDEVTDVSVLPDQMEETNVEFLAGAALHESELIGVVDVPAMFQALEREAAL